MMIVDNAIVTLAGASSKLDEIRQRARQRLSVTSGEEVSLTPSALYLCQTVASIMILVLNNDVKDIIWLALIGVAFRTSAANSVWATRASVVLAVAVRFAMTPPSVCSVGCALLLYSLKSEEILKALVFVAVASTAETLRFNVLNMIVLGVPMQILGFREPCIRFLNNAEALLLRIYTQLAVEIGIEGVVNMGVFPGTVILALFAKRLSHVPMLRHAVLLILILMTFAQMSREVGTLSLLSAKPWPKLQTVFRAINLNASSRQYEDLTLTILLTMQTERLWAHDMPIFSFVFCIFTIVCVRRRAAVLLSFSLVFSSAYILMLGGQNDQAAQLSELFLLSQTSIRIKLALRDEIRASGRVIFSHSVASCAIALAHGCQLNIVLIALGIAASIYFSQTRRDSVGRGLIVKEIESRNFIDHAIKQKLAGAATSIELVLTDPALIRSFNPETLAVMTTALAECRLGTALCLETTLKRQLTEGTYVAHQAERELGVVIDAWTRDWRDVSFRLVSSRTFRHLDKLGNLTENDLTLDSEKLHSYLVGLDWNLFNNVLESVITRVRVGSKSSDFFVTLSRPLNKPTELQLKCHLKQPLGRLCALQPLFDTIHARTDVRNGWFSVSIAVTSARKKPSRKAKLHAGAPVDSSTTPASVSAQQLQHPASEDPLAVPPPLPAGLVFAVLDDSAIVRVNLKIIATRFWEASPESVFVGEKEQDAMNFVQLCVEKIKPDICILDENLDYSNGEGRLISGSSLAHDLRAAGFEGVIAIHSANELLASDIDLRTVDGFVRKGANRTTIKNEFARWYARRSGHHSS